MRNIRGLKSRIPINIASSQHLYHAVAANDAIGTAGLEAIVVGAVGTRGGVGVPEVLVSPHVAGMEHLHAPLVEYPHFVHGIEPEVDEVLNLPAVVLSVAVGSHQIGEFEPRGDNGDGMGCGVDTGVGDSLIVRLLDCLIVWIDDCLGEDGGEGDVKVALRQVAAPAVERRETGKAVESAVGGLNGP